MPRMKQKSVLRITVRRLISAIELRQPHPMQIDPNLGIHQFLSPTRDYLVYNQVWAPTLFAWDLHGMWPTQFDDRYKPAYCDPQNASLFHLRHRREIDRNLENRMHSKWPSLTSDDHIFWNNQWIKHGYVKYKVNEKPTPQTLIPKNIILIIPTIGKGMNSKVGAKISQVGPKPTGVAGSNGRVYGRGSYATTLKDGSAKGWIYFHGDRWFANIWKGKENGKGCFYTGDAFFGKDRWRLGTSEPISQKVSPLKVLDNVNLLHKSNKSYLPLCCNKDSELKSSNTSLEDCSRSFSGFSFPDEDSLTHDGPFSTLEVLEVRIPPRIDSFMSSPESNLIEDDLDSPDSTFEDDQHPGYDCSVKGAPELNTKSDDAFFLAISKTDGGLERVN
ncbi:unnamed protein product [Vicia faba]|uniref:Uncharacterized protein n=1 Tax=Vicia faba TaxID=3906 RepID=A0AAV1A741_VICFA|nr:unnamed protein product [Vicia faba]